MCLNCTQKLNFSSSHKQKKFPNTSFKQDRHFNKHCLPKLKKEKKLQKPGSAGRIPAHS